MKRAKRLLIEAKRMRRRLGREPRMRVVRKRNAYKQSVEWCSAIDSAIDNIEPIELKADWTEYEPEYHFDFGWEFDFWGWKADQAECHLVESILDCVDNHIYENEEDDEQDMSCPT